MHWIDYSIFVVYFGLILSVGFYFYHRNKSKEDYYVGNRAMSATHVGLSIVATDVGGGFSIGLGGLGFLMGLSGSWLLFTGLVGAWLSAVLVVPRVKGLDAKAGMLTFPDFLRFKYGNRVALITAIISGIGYMGFTGGQILAGVKLASGSVFSEITFMDPVLFSFLTMAGIIIIYTVIGGLKAVIYTDTVQWIVLLGGLLVFGLPFTFLRSGGFASIFEALPPDFFNIFHIEPVQIINWFVTIIPIWFIAMTLYQRIYACRNIRESKRSFYIAGLLEYPLMAFLGVSLGMLARIFFPEADAETAMPMLLSHVLPVGISGIVIAAYFSAIMSTADSCLIASSGNVVNDILERHGFKNLSVKSSMRLSQWVTLGIGVLATVIAASFSTVLEIILNAYAFMVAGLFVPTLGALFLKRPHENAAIVSMLGGGLTALFFIYKNWQPWGLNASAFGLCVSLILFAISHAVYHHRSSHA